MGRSWSKRRVSVASTLALGLAVLPLSVSTAAGAAPAAAGSAAWTIQPSPDQPGATGSQLAAVSCVKGGSCTAVGTYFTATGTPRHQFTLAEQRSGDTWVLERTPALKGVGWSLFSGVSCVAADSCLAVGYTVSHATTGFVRPLAELWNGKSWVADSPAEPAGPSPWAILDDVSCPTATFCLAVGGYIKNLSGGQEQPLAEEWNGTSWTRLTAPNPHAENGSELTSVHCVAPTSCEIDGDYDYADVAQSVFAYSYNGTSWAAQKQVNPAGQESNSDNAVSCTSASACTSVGSWTSIGALALAERWNGTAWSRQKLPTPPGSKTDELTGVSCPAATACTAVGDSAASYQDNPTATLAMTWNGTSWQLDTTPTPTGGGGLAGVFCTTSADCVAVGTAGTSTLVEVSPEA